MPSPGDLIEIFRGLYKHWAVYVGDGYVVHLVNLNSGGSSFSSSSSSGTQSRKGKGKVKKEKLDDVGGNVWRVYNELDGIYKPRPAEEIVDEALSMVGNDVNYDLLEWNCEHFAKWLRYGVNNSSQVDEHVRNVGMVAGFMMGGPMGAPIGMAVASTDAGKTVIKSYGRVFGNIFG